MVETLLVDMAEIEREGLVDWETVLEITEEGFEAMGEHGDYVNKPRRRLHSPTLARTSMHAGAHVPMGALGMLIHCEKPTVSEGMDVQKILSRGDYTYVLFSTETGELKSVLRADRTQKPIPSDFRTPATSIVGNKHLARPESEVLALFGSKYEARCHLEATTHAFDLREVRIYSPTEEHRTSFATEMNDRFDFEVRAVDTPKEAVRGADIIQEATNTSDPVFDGEDLEPGQHVCTIAGSNKELIQQQGRIRRSLDLATIQRADRIFVLLLEQLELDREPNLFEPIQFDLISWEDIDEIGDLMNGTATGRNSDDEITVFSNGAGMGVVDVGVAAYFDQLARENGLGTPI